MALAAPAHAGRADEVADGAGDGGGGRVTEFVRLEVDGGVGTIRLDRPPMNAISRAVGDAVSYTHLTLPTN